MLVAVCPCALAPSDDPVLDLEPAVAHVVANRKPIPRKAVQPSEQGKFTYDLAVNLLDTLPWDEALQKAELAWQEHKDRRMYEDTAIDKDNDDVEVIEGSMRAKRLPSSAVAMRTTCSWRPKTSRIDLFARSAASTAALLVDAEIIIAFTSAPI